LAVAALAQVLLERDELDGDAAEAVVRAAMAATP
jgi:hypothetical protein